MRSVPRRVDPPAAIGDGRPPPVDELPPPPEDGIAPQAPDDAPMPPRRSEAAMRKRHVRGSSLLLIGRGLTLLITTATQVVIVRYLSKADYGAFAYALVLAGA